MFAFLIDLLCIGAITRLTLGIAKNLGWLNFSDSYLSLYGFTALLIYLGVFCFIDETQSWPNDWENDLRYSSHQL